MKHRGYATIARLAPVVGFALGVVLWVLDAAIDAFILEPDEAFLHAIWSDESTEVWMRSLVILVMTASAMVAGHFMCKQHALQQELRQKNKELERLASTDALTGLLNRRKFVEVLTAEMQRARRYGQPLSLVMFDLDYFKRLNDDHGHPTGDAALQFVAEMLRANLRQSDSCSRWGGEEFLVLLPQSDEQAAARIAEKLRAQLGVIELPGGPVTLTASFGVVQVHPDESLDRWLTRADAALYRAKDGGRDRVHVEPSPQAM